MIPIIIKKRRGSKEWIDPVGLEKTRAVLEEGLQALVIDLDKCLINYYAGAPAFQELLKNRDARKRDLLAYLILLLRMLVSFSAFKRVLPKRWQLSSTQFQELSLLFELKTTEEIMNAAVERGMPHLLSLVRQPLLELCRLAEQRGAEVILATANSATYAEPLAKRLGIPTVLASRLDRKEGRVAQLLIGEDKKKAVLEYLQKRRIPIDRSWLIVDLDFTGNDRALIQAFGERVSLVANKS